MLEKPDIPRLYRLVDWAATEDAKPHSGEWDQNVYVCGTSRCVAGKTVLEEGGTDWFGSTIRRPDGGRTFIERWARKILGLNEDEAWALFDPKNTVDDLREVVADIEIGVYR